MDNTLVHYGILGMKWGVRRTKAQLARARGEQLQSSKGTSTKESGKVSSTAGAKKKVADMSDDELRKAVNRMQLEKQYRELSPKQVSLGKKFVDTTLKQVVIPAATTASKNYLTKYIEKELEKSMNKK